jgi:hypothetical protein
MIEMISLYGTGATLILGNSSTYKESKELGVDVGLCLAFLNATQTSSS